MKKTLESILLTLGLTLAPLAPAQAQGFEGVYVGVYGGKPTSGGAGGVLRGFQGGYNFAFDSGALAGIEADVFSTNTGIVFSTAVGRLGYALGPDMMLYGSAGIGKTGTTTYYQFGAGAELNVTDNLYVRSGVDRLKPLNFGVPRFISKIGAGFRF